MPDLNKVVTAFIKRRNRIKLGRNYVRIFGELALWESQFHNCFKKFFISQFDTKAAPRLGKCIEFDSNKIVAIVTSNPHYVAKEMQSKKCLLPSRHFDSSWTQRTSFDGAYKHLRNVPEKRGKRSFFKASNNLLWEVDCFEETEMKTILVPRIEQSLRKSTVENWTGSTFTNCHS